MFAAVGVKVSAKPVEAVKQLVQLVLIVGRLGVRVVYLSGYRLKPAEVLEGLAARGLVGRVAGSGRTSAR